MSFFIEWIDNTYYQARVDFGRVFLFSEGGQELFKVFLYWQSLSTFCMKSAIYMKKRHFYWKYGWMPHFGLVYQHLQNLVYLTQGAWSKPIWKFYNILPFSIKALLKHNWIFKSGFSLIIMKHPILKSFCLIYFTTRLCKKRKSKIWMWLKEDGINYSVYHTLLEVIWYNGHT